MRQRVQQEDGAEEEEQQEQKKEGRGGKERSRRIKSENHSQRFGNYRQRDPN